MKEYAISLEDVVGLLESIRLLEGATLTLDTKVASRVSDEVEWMTGLLVDMIKEDE